MNKKYLLQLGLAFVLLYASINALIYPNDWARHIPNWVQYFGISKVLALHLHSAVQIILGLALLLNYKVKTAAMLVAIDFAAIFAATGFEKEIFSATFRNVGLFFMSLYLGVRGRY